MVEKLYRKTKFGETLPREEKEKGGIVHMEIKNKRVSTWIQIMLCLAILMVAAVNAHGQKVNIQKDIANEIIRFHVLANSDSQEDQNLKLKVKGEVVKYLQKKLLDAYDVASAREIIDQEKSHIENVARNVIISEGYHYSVTVKLARCNFPTKKYGDLTFPAGEYEALRVLIGKAEGKNWWCVMFPSLCFINETYSVVPEDSKDKLKYVLSEEEYSSLIQGEEIENNSDVQTEVTSSVTESNGENLNDENLNEETSQNPMEAAEEVVSEDTNLKTNIEIGSDSKESKDEKATQETNGAKIKVKFKIFELFKNNW